MSTALRLCAAVGLVLSAGLPAASGQAGSGAPSPAERYEALNKEWNESARGLWLATTEGERKQLAARVAALSPHVLAFAEKYPNEPTAFDALVQVATQELWLENNTTFPGRQNEHPGARAFALLVRNHARSDRLADPCRRLAGGFSRSCEGFFRAIVEKNPDRDIRGNACLRLAQFLNGRLRRLELIRERPEMAARYRRLFGSDFMDGLLRRDRAKAMAEVEGLFERAARDYGDVKLQYEGTIAEKCASELHEIRQLSVGKQAPEIAGHDQEGTPFKLSDYRGKVVLLYFWSEY